MYAPDEYKVYSSDELNISTTINLPMLKAEVVTSVGYYLGLYKNMLKWNNPDKAILSIAHIVRASYLLRNIAENKKLTDFTLGKEVYDTIMETDASGEVDLCTFYIIY